MADSVILEANSLEETLERWGCELEFRGFMNLNPPEEIQICDSLERITASPAIAVHSSPHFYSASADGIAILSSKTYGAAETNPLVVHMGKDAQFVDTGTPIPPGFDTVAPIEEIRFRSIEEVEVNRNYAPWENVRPLGEELAAKEIIIPSNHRIRPFDIAALYTGGLTTVNVIKKPRIGIVAVGSSLVPIGEEPLDGQSLETSSQILINLARQWGAESVKYEIVPEDINEISGIISKATTEVDLLCIIAGPSRGTRLIAKIINTEGELLAYGLKVKPGMSACLGVVNNCPVMGLPGYPMSAFLIFDLFAKPAIHRKMGVEPSCRNVVKAYLSRTIQSPLGVREYIRTSLGDVDGLPVAAPISRGANILMSLVRADGLIKVEADRKEIKTGEPVQVELLKNYADIQKIVMITGTHDICFDILNNRLQQRCHDVCINQSNVGSMHGIIALKAGYCHIASIHLFDDETGEYNTPIVKRFLSDLPLIMVNFFHRSLGFIVPKGNPKQIKTFHDLTREDVKMVNRIRGAGTRLVLDYHLKKNGIGVNEVRGYTLEAHTHLNLATVVASGNADVGLGILAAAKASGLDFIPVIKEKLDLVIPRKFLNTYPVTCLLETLTSESFKREVDTLDGYDTSSMGKVTFEI